MTRKSTKFYTHFHPLKQSEHNMMLCFWYGCCDVENKLLLCALRVSFFAFFSGEEKWLKGQEKKSFFFRYLWKNFQTFFKVSKNSVWLQIAQETSNLYHRTYPERQVHQNDEEFYDWTARIHFFKTFFLPFFHRKYFFTSFLSSRKEFSFIIKWKTVFPPSHNLLHFLSFLLAYQENIRVATTEILKCLQATEAMKKTSLVLVVWMERRERGACAMFYVFSGRIQCYSI